MYKIISFILGLPKSLYFNIKYFGILKGLRLPVILAHTVSFRVTKGQIKLPQTISLGLVKIGFGDVGIFDRRYSRSILDISGKIIIKGSCNLGHGTKISVGKAGCLEIGENLIISAESRIICHHHIEIGANCLFSWDIQIMDTDFHKIFQDNKRVNEDAKVTICNNVWLGSKCQILKGCHIPSGCIIGAGSLVSKNLDEPNAIYSGIPAVIKKRDISWEM